MPRSTCSSWRRSWWPGSARPRLCVSSWRRLRTSSPQQSGADAEREKARSELAAAQAEVVKTKAELAAAKRSAEVELVKAKAKLAEAELESAKATTVQQLLASAEHVRRRAEQALEGYERWRGRHPPAGHAA
ncbi:uncharacterized abhydrolase domain-containing protein DDB_G0269086-like [Triticum urartu]|uniref:uncharacterized abhydrolase domain-containing protein DDB_G0269086-like n=1 Tax=Triticum urartu TaxID=4572 RepID=UPI002043301C|nr:uncharacterized abhydrolase domain-containing protein DDB_G0269086-like [Triticum urartu]